MFQTIKTACIVCSTVAGTLITSHVQADTNPVVDVFILAGQSNMVGAGDPQNLPDHLAQFIDPNPNVMFRSWLNGAEYGTDWGPLEPRGSSNFGPEMMFGNVLSDVHPDRTIAFMKIAYNGTNLACAWNPEGCGLNLFATLVETIDEWKEELEDLNYTVRFAGFVWVQGEGDCTALWAATPYGDNLMALIDGVRTAAGASKMPAVVAKVNPRTSSYPYVDVVHEGMDNVATNDPKVATVTCKTIELKADEIHFSSTGMITLGAALGDTMLGLDPFGLAEEFEACPSDLNVDGEVNVLDILQMISEFGPCP